MSSYCACFSILDRRDRDRFLAFYAREGVPVPFQFMGKGTASMEILSLLGIGDSDKLVLASVLPTPEARRVTLELDIALRMNQPGAVAFSLPLDAVGGLRALQAVSAISPITGATGESGTKAHASIGSFHRPEDARMTSAEIIKHLDHFGRETQNGDGHKETHEPLKFELVIVIANKGYVDMIMKAARGAGATGGTIIHAGGTRGAGQEKFYEISLQNDKDMVWILVPAAIRVAVMKAVMAQAGTGTDANAVVFSLPVMDVAGIRLPSM